MSAMYYKQAVLNSAKPPPSNDAKYAAGARPAAYLVCYNFSITVPLKLVQEIL